MKKLVPPDPLGDWDEAAHQPHQEVLFRLDLLAAAESHFDPGEDQDAAEQVHHPVESFDQPDAGDDEYGAHRQCSENAPFEDLRLVMPSDMEVGKDHDEDEEVVDGERLFDDVAGQEFQCLCRAEIYIDAGGECQRQRYPDQRPGKGLAKSDLVALPVEYSQIECEHDGYDCGKSKPHHCLNGHAIGLSFPGCGVR